jgi:hypothetical protein
VVLLRGVSGLDMPPEVQFRSQFQGDGTLVLGARADGRPIMLPVSIRAATLLELEDKRRELLRMFDRRRGPGTFTWALRDGSARSIGLLYESGFSTALRGHSGAWPLRFEYQIVCWADDPYFYGGEQMLSFTPPVGDDGPFYPGPPFQIGGGPAPGPGRATRLCRPARRAGAAGAMRWKTSVCPRSGLAGCGRRLLLGAAICACCSCSRIRRTCASVVDWMVTE